MHQRSILSHFLVIVAFLFGSVMFSLPADAQNKTPDQTVNIGGKSYRLYQVMAGDGLYGVARKFGVTVDEIRKVNPEVENQLRSGQTLKIPVAPTQSSSIVKSVNSDSDENFHYYSVKKKETVFSVAQRNGITSEDIYQYNPTSREGIKEGDVLKLPKPSPVKKPSSLNVSKHSVKHVVARKETLFSIAKQYNTTQEEILALNPNLKGPLTKGQVLDVPDPTVLSEEPKNVTPSKPSGKSSTVTYQIVPGDNLFQLQKRFGTTADVLFDLNPELKQGVKTGMTILVPVFSSSVNTVGDKAPNNEPSKAKISDDPILSPRSGAIEVGLLLPFCKALNDSSKITPKTTGFLEFYAGVLLAVEKLKDSGVKTNLHVFDTEQDNKVIEKITKNPILPTLNLVIGPVYPQNQKGIAEFTAKNHIPMVSPLSSESRMTLISPNYYQINPLRKLRLSATAEYIADHYSKSNIILLSNGYATNSEKIISEKLNQSWGQAKLKKYNIWSEGVAGLEALLKPEADNVIILVETREAEVSVAMTRLNTVSKTMPISVVGIQEYTRMQSIDTEYLHNIRLRYLSPYYVDYTNKQVSSFVSRYRNAFGAEPTQYSFQGYDIATHFISALAGKSKSIKDSSQGAASRLLQADYHFARVGENGGYMNTNFAVIEYTPSYEVKLDGKFHASIVSFTSSESAE